MARIFGLVVILACSTFIISSNTTRSLARWYKHDSNTHIYSAALQYTNVYFIECYGTRTQQLQNNCSLKIHMTNNSDSHDLRSGNTCQLPAVHGKSYQNDMVLNISPLSDEKILIGRAALLSNDSTRITLQLLLIDSVNCDITANKVLLNEESFGNMFILVGRDSFGVAFKDEKVCKDFCLEKFVNEGRIAEGPFNFSFDSPEAQEYVILFGTNANLAKLDNEMTVESEERLNATLFFSNGNREIMKDSKNVIGKAVSTANGILSLCKQDKRFRHSLRCSQGNMLKWNQLPFTYELQNFLIYSLAENKYLALSIKSVDHTNKEDKSLYLQFYLTVFDDGPDLHDGVEAFRLRKNDGLFAVTRSHIFENNNSEYCVSLFDQVENQLNSNCFSKELFE